MNAIFLKPVAVTQFWASTDYNASGVENDLGKFYLFAESDKPEKWFVQVTVGGSDYFVGDYVSPFLPTLRNIQNLNKAANEMLEIALTSERNGRLIPPKHSPLSTLESSTIPVLRDVGNLKYRNALFKVLEQDWGILIPEIDRLGTDAIQLDYKFGMPCAPAMISAAQPILEAALGPLKKGNVVTIKEGGRVVDVVDYNSDGILIIKQRYDVTEYFGKSLHSTNFDINTRQKIQSPPQDGCENSVQETIVAFMKEVMSAVVGGNHPAISICAVYQATTGRPAPSAWIIKPELRNVFVDLVRSTHQRSPTEIEVQWAVQIAKDCGLSEDQGGKLRFEMPEYLVKKKWWKFWQ